MSNIKGLDNLMRKLDALGGNSKKALQVGVLQAAKKVQGDAKDLCPVDQGQLSNSIQARVEESDGKIVGMISTNVEYAPYVEFGTGKKGESSPSPPKYDGTLNYRQDWSGMKAQPFMYPAAAQNKIIVPKIISAHLRKEIRKLGGR
ncbi:HK97 gp10 family phage protein [Paenibacillus anaericanus]|uniref:HK97-gp10 family putative phage morphogenesis protein n=1 Tax=Paenibacillus anaericanus TaxID=170367 RepID=UPI002781AE30|nr:HK97-gp10 family putative phage morphogenesis protein [Paenibacillus anaericanus]MDQ0091666.1 HK97 gp10 family phage protein [Paenibacillus anaericanus]